MVSAGYKYKAKWIKFPQDKYTTFQISTKDKKTNEYKNFNVFVNAKVDVQDDDEITLDKITGVDHQAYFSQKANKEFLNVTIFAEISVVGLAGGEQALEQTLDIASDLLPF